ncbi:hypothetical protein G7Y41_00195 [Schaalia sp. ZJ405]|uniref:hypothetical protein n=1 Tax=unclassified Schaalia TaxID=2691889 RepID=UPI0013EE0423|nr:MULTISPECIES: hypothetical protein [unclassified Schaalia]QPK81351.1 hypothetical protein G7Y41_00195 [Schaalia sp. ZJ405]
MEHIVKSELTQARWQVAADATAIISVIVLLAALGIFAAVSVGSTISVVIAALVGLSALLFVPAIYALMNRPQH